MHNLTVPPAYFQVTFLLFQGHWKWEFARDIWIGFSNVWAPVSATSAVQLRMTYQALVCGISFWPFPPRSGAEATVAPQSYILKWLHPWPVDGTSTPTQLPDVLGKWTVFQAETESSPWDLPRSCLLISAPNTSFI